MILWLNEVFLSHSLDPLLFTDEQLAKFDELLNSMDVAHYCFLYLLSEYLSNITKLCARNLMNMNNIKRCVFVFCFSDIQGLGTNAGAWRFSSRNLHSQFLSTIPYEFHEIVNFLVFAHS